ncbi:MAG: hypothetical protein V4773_04305 [Verrucomicrobiota bacterium]
MSFLAPKTELPAGLSNATPGRTTNGSPTEVLPMVFGRARVVARWQTPVLHWLSRAGKAGDYWHFSCLGWLCLGPVDEIRRVWVGEKPGSAYTDFDANRVDYPGADYVEQTISQETPATLRAYWGLETQASPAAFINGTVIRNGGHPMAGKTHPKYKGICYIILKDVFAGTATETTPQLPRVEVEVYRRSPTAYSFGGIAWGTHPVGIVKDLLTTKRGGAKLPESYFDGPHWEAAMQRIMDVGVAGKKSIDLYLSAVFDQPRPVGDQVADVLSYFDAHIRERAGKLQIDWFPNDGSTASPAGLREISEHQRAGDLEIDSTDIEEMKTKVIVSGLDYTADPAFSESSEDEQVPYAVRFIGQQRPPEAVSRPFFITRAQQKSYAKMQAAILATPQLKATVPVLRQYATHPDGITPLRPGDRFNLDDGEKGLDLVVRITERIEDGAKVIFKVVQERGAFPQPYEPPLDPRSDLTRPPPADFARYAVAQLPPDLSNAADTVVAALIERASNDTQGYDLHFSPNNTWPGQVIAAAQTRFAVCAVLQTTLGATLGDAGIAVNGVGNDWSYLRSQSALEQADDQLLMWHAGEWFSVGTITPLGGGSYSMVIKRARLGSLAVAHAIGVVLFLIPRSELVAVNHTDFANVESAGVYNAGVATKYFKTRPLGPGGLQGNLTAAFSCQLRDPTPDAIVDLVATTGTGKIVQLRWTPDTAALVNDYHIYRATGPGFFDEAKIGEVSGSRFFDVTVVMGVQYRYRLKAVATDETDSPFSNAVLATPGVIAGGDLDTTPPSNPGAITFASSGTYLGDDGTVFAYVRLNVPAMPAGAVGQSVLQRRSGATGAMSVVAQPSNALGTTVQIDDLTPGTSYDFALEAFSFSGVTSAIIFATGTPFTAPGKTAQPGACTSVAYVAGSNGAFERPPAYGGVGREMLFSTRITWVGPVDKDFLHFEWCFTAFDTNAAASDPFTPKYHGPIPETRFDSLLPTAVYFRVRAVNTSLVPGPWAGGGTSLATVTGYPAGDMTEQFASDVNVTGIKTGSGSVNDVLVRQPYIGGHGAGTGYVLTSATTGDFTLSLSGMGFSTAPDTAWLQCANPGIMITYDWNDSASTFAIFRIRGIDGTTLPSTLIMNGELIEYF